MVTNIRGGITPLDYQALTRVAAAEAGGLRTERDAGLQAVIDTILNRVASPSFPSSVSGVVNQGAQRVNGSQFTPVAQAGGSWTQLPRAPADMERGLAAYLTSRAAGAPNQIGDSVNYLNPYYSSRRSMTRWGNDVVADNSGVFGDGKNIHYHGTAPGLTPTEAGYKLSPELAAQFGYANPETAAAHAILPDEITGYDTGPSIPNPRMRPDRSMGFTTAYAPAYAPENYVRPTLPASAPLPDPQTPAVMPQWSEADAMTEVDVNGNYINQPIRPANDASDIPNPRPRPAVEFQHNAVSGAPDAGIVSLPNLSQRAKDQISSLNAAMVPRARPTDMFYINDVSGAPDNPPDPTARPYRGSPSEVMGGLAPRSFPAFYGEQSPTLSGGMSGVIGDNGMPNIDNTPALRTTGNNDTLYGPGNDAGTSRFNTWQQMNHLTMDDSVRQKNNLQRAINDASWESLPNIMQPYNPPPSITWREQMNDVAGPQTAAQVAALPNMNVTSFPRGEPSPSTFSPPADTARDWFTGNTQGYTDNAFGPPTAPPQSPAAGYDQYVPWTQSAPVTARPTVSLTGDRPRMSTENWGDTGTYMTRDGLPERSAPVGPMSSYQPHGAQDAIRDAYGLPSAIMAYNGEGSSVAPTGADSLGTEDADYQQWRKETYPNGVPTPGTGAPSDPIQDPEQQAPSTPDFSWFPGAQIAQPASAPLPGLSQTPRPMGQPTMPASMGVPGIVRNVVSAPSRGVLGGLARILGRNSPATFTPSGTGGVAPYGINGTTNWQSGTTNALGGANALSWQGSNGSTVTVAQDPWSGTYYGPSYS